MPRSRTSWVAVCDGGQARIFVDTGTPVDPRLRLKREFEIETPPDRSLASDRPGRMPDPGHGYSAMDETDRHDKAEEDFAGTIAEALNTAALASEFDELVLFADASTLGSMRPLLHKETQARLWKDIALDLTNEAVRDLETRLRKLRELPE